MWALEGTRRGGGKGMEVKKGACFYCVGCNVRAFQKIF